MSAKAALVTGGGTGIGRVIAIELAKNGYDVGINYHSSSSGALETAKEIRALGRAAAAFQADLSKVSQIQKMFREFCGCFDRLDLFVNNAGVTLKAPFLETDEKSFDKMCDLDFKGAYFCMQSAAKVMIEKNSAGSIVVISSNNFKVHFADVSVYGSLKAGLNKMTGHIALELAKHNIRVNTVAPGWTDTGAPRLDQKESTYYKIPLKKWAAPDEIASAVLYFASDSARSITGATLVIDNGASLIADKAEKYGL